MSDLPAWLYPKAPHRSWLPPCPGRQVGVGACPTLSVDLITQANRLARQCFVAKSSLISVDSRRSWRLAAQAAQCVARHGQRLRWPTLSGRPPAALSLIPVRHDAHGEKPRCLWTYRYRATYRRPWIHRSNAGHCAKWRPTPVSGARSA